MMSITKSAPITRSLIEIKAGKHISKGPGVAFWNRKKDEDHGKLKIEGAIGDVAEGILKTLMNGLKEGEESVIDKITIHPEGVWIVLATNNSMPIEKIIGFAEGVLAHATQAHA